MRYELAELYKFRGLLWQLVRRDLKVRYKNSRFGFLWSIAPPLMQVAVISFAFRHATNFAANFDSYSAFVLVAIIPWTYFQTAILDSSQSILMMYGVIKKVYMPREIIPLAAAISNFIHFLLSWTIFFLYLVFYLHAKILPTTIWLPYLLLVQFMLVTGLSLLVSCLNVFYEDVKYLVTIVMSLFLFLLPIMYIVEQVAASSLFIRHPLLLKLYMMNPITALINGYRKTLLEAPRPEAIAGSGHSIASLPLDIPGLLITGLISFLILICSYAYFNHRKWQFVERP